MDSTEDLNQPNDSGSQNSADEALRAGTGAAAEAELPESYPPVPGQKKKKKKNDGLGTTRGIETMFRTSYRVHMDLSSLADAKANIMISINGIIISIIIAAISPKIDTNPWLLVPTSVMLLGSLISIVYAVRSARPRINSKLITLDDVAKNRVNILFFGHFTRLSEDDFIQGMSNLLSDTTTLYHNMMRDIYGLGQVLTRKFELLRISYTVFMFGLIIGIVLFIFAYVWIVFSIGPTELAANFSIPRISHG